LEKSNKGIIMKTVLIYGATSAIAQATAVNFALDKWKLLLVAKNENKLNDLANDLKTRYSADVSTFYFDAIDDATYQKSFDEALANAGAIDAVLIAHGTLPDQEKIASNLDAINREIVANGVSVVNLATIAANYFEPLGKGMIAVISSVAGDRGRQSNYIYGAAKGFVSTYFQGLRNRMFHKGVSVLTIKPGFVDTPMTSHVPKNFLFASYPAVGKKIFEAMKAGKSGVIYVPGFWRLIMCIVKSVPESLFMKLKM